MSHQGISSARSRRARLALPVQGDSQQPCRGHPVSHTGLGRAVPALRTPQPRVAGSTHHHGPVPQEVEVAVLAKEVTLGMRGVELLPSHDEVVGKVTPWNENTASV